MSHTLDDGLQLVGGGMPWARLVRPAPTLPFRSWAQTVLNVVFGQTHRVREGALAASVMSDAEASREAVRDQDSHAGFRRSVVPQLDAAYNFARFLARDPDAAQDIVQEAFLKAYRGFNGFRGGDARPWLFAIVRNCFLDWEAERRRKRRVEVEIPDGAETLDAFEAVEPWASEEETPEAALIRKSDAEAIRSLLLGLPTQLREVLVLRELEELSYREIADVAGIPIGTVMSRIARARGALADAWRKAEGAGS